MHKIPLFHYLDKIKLLNYILIAFLYCFIESLKWTTALLRFFIQTYIVKNCTRLEVQIRPKIFIIMIKHGVVTGPILATVYHHHHQFGRGMLTLYSIGYSNVHIKHQECAKEDQKQQPATTASDITGGPLHENFRSFNTIYPRTSVTVNPRFVTVWIISVSLGFLAVHHVVLMALTVRVIVNEVHTVRNSPHS